jgi:hypothetical protein
MTREEKLQYFKSVEPKLRDLFLFKGGEELTNSDYEEFNIIGEDIQLFKETYKILWNEAFIEFSDPANVIEERDYLSDGALEFLALSEEHNTIDENDDIFLEFETISGAIQNGVSLSISLKNKIKRLIKSPHDLNPFMKVERENEFIKLNKELILSNKTINQLIITMYNLCDEHFIFWHNSDVLVYRNYYHLIKDNYLKELLNSNELDFLKNEYKHFFIDEINSINVSYTFLDTDFKDSLLMFNYVKFLNNKNREFLNLVKQRKLDFITEEIFKRGFTVEVVQKKKEILINLVPIIENNFEDAELNLSQLPPYNIEQRYELLVQLGIESNISKLDTSKNSKNMLLGLIMGVSVDNAKKLLNGTYKLNSDKEKTKIRKAEITNEIKDFFERNKIKLNN